MVQIRPESTFHLDDYWKLISGDSESKEDLLQVMMAKYRVCKSIRVTRLRELYVRYQRGLPSYEGLPVRELRSFILQRRLPATTDKKPTRSNLKAQLEQADDLATFDRFSELPPEIRQQIFRQYFDSFDDSFKSSEDSHNDFQHRRSILGCPPPITLATKQIRQEALPLFFSRCHFAIEVSPHKGQGFSRYFESFVENTSTHDFARIRFLCLEFFPSKRTEWFWVHVAININDEECPAKVVPSYFKNHNHGTNSEEIQNRLNTLLMLEPRTLVRSIAAREGCLKLQKDDISVLSESLWRALEQGLKGE